MKFKKKGLVISAAVLSAVILLSAVTLFGGTPKRLIDMMYSDVGGNAAANTRANDAATVTPGKKAGEEVIVAYNETKDKSYPSLITAIAEAESNDVIVLKQSVKLTNAAAQRIRITDGRTLTIKAEGSVTISTDASAFPFITLTTPAPAAGAELVPSELNLSGDITIDGTNFTGTSAITVTGGSKLSLTDTKIQKVSKIAAALTGSAENDPASALGTVIYADGSTCTVSNVSVTDCTASMTNTGTSLESDGKTPATPVYSSAWGDNTCLIELKNSATLTGSGLNISSCNATNAVKAESGTVLSLTSSSVKNGNCGAVYGSGADVSLTGFTVSDTTSSYSRALVITGEGAKLTLKNSTVQNHKVTVSTAGGAGLFADDNVAVVIDGSEIKNNVAANANAVSGGVFFSSKTRKVTGTDGKETEETYYPTVTLKNKVTVSGNKAATAVKNLYANYDILFVDGGLSSSSSIGFSRYESATTNTIIKNTDVYKSFVCDDSNYTTGYNDTYTIYGEKLTVKFAADMSTGSKSDMYTCAGSYFTFPKNDNSFEKYYNKFLYWNTVRGSVISDMITSGRLNEPGVTFDYGTRYDEEQKVKITTDMFTDKVLTVYPIWQRYAAMIGSTMYLSVADAVNAAQTTSVGTTIKIIGDSEIDDTIVISKSITITSDDSLPAGITVPDSDDNLAKRMLKRPMYEKLTDEGAAHRNDPMFEITNGAELTLKGLTECNLEFSGTYSAGVEAGSAYFKVTNGTLNLYENAVVTDCGNLSTDSSAVHNGGAIYVAAGSTLNVRGGKITGNKALYGGAVYLEGSETASGGAKMNVTTGEFTLPNGQKEAVVVKINDNKSEPPAAGNDSSKIGAGGAIYAGKNTRLTIETATMNSNESRTDGGVGGSIAAYEATVTINNLNCDYNQANLHGGSVYVEKGSLSIVGKSSFNNSIAANGFGGALYLKNCSYTLSGDASERAFSIHKGIAHSGSGVYITGSTGTMSNLDIYENTAKFRANETDGFGGGIYLGSGSTLSATQVHIYSNTVITKGGGVYIDPTSTFNATACNINNNIANYVDPNSQDSTQDGTDTSESTDTGIAPSIYAEGGGVYIDGSAKIISTKITENFGELGGGVFLPSTGKLTLGGITDISSNNYNVALVNTATEYNNLYIENNSSVKSEGLTTGATVFVSLNMNGKFYGTFMTGNSHAENDAALFYVDSPRTLDSDDEDPADKDTTSYIIGYTSDTVFVNRRIAIVFNAGDSEDVQDEDAMPIQYRAFGGELKIPENNFKYNGFTFSHWECDLPGDETEYQPGDILRIPSDNDSLYRIGLTAIWSNNVAKVENKYFTTIEEAIEYAGNGTTDEECTVTILRSLAVDNTLQINKSVRITSEKGYSLYRSNEFNGATPLISVNKNVTEGKNGLLTLGNIVITGELFDTEASDEFSAPLIYVTGTLATKENTVLKNNKSSGLGGAVQIMGDGSYNCIGSTISGCKARRGGAIYCESSKGELYIKGATIISNTADEFGGGIYTKNAKVTITENTLDGKYVPTHIGTAGNGNTALAGAGIYCESGAVELINAEVSYNFINSAEFVANYTAGGAGVYVEAAAFKMSSTGSKITNNTVNAPGKSSYGAGVYVGVGSFTMNNGYIKDNRGAGSTTGGGVYTTKEITVGGSAEIFDNFTGSTKSNLYLGCAGGSNVSAKIQMNGSLGNKIGVTLGNTTGPVLNSASVKTYLTDANRTNQYKTNIISDNDSYMVYGNYDVSDNLVDERNIYITKRITVSYNFNKGTTKSIPQTQYVYSDFTNTLYTTRDVTRQGYNISGDTGYWVSTLNSGVRYDATNRYVKPERGWGDFTVTVQWTPIQIEAIVTASEISLQYKESINYQLPVSIKNDAAEGDGSGPVYYISSSGGTLPTGLYLSDDRLMGAPTEVGDFVFILSIKGRNGTEAYATFTITVGGAPGYITIDNDVSKDYDGIPMAYPNFTRLGTGKVKITFNGDTNPPTECGEYKVVISVEKDRYYNAISITETFYIRKISRGFTYRDFTQTKVFDDKEASIPPVYAQVYDALEGTYKYEFRWYDSLATAQSDTTGSQKRSAPPVDAGTYYVRMFVEGDNNYYPELSKVYTYTITKKDVSVVWGKTSFMYDKAAHKPEAYFVDVYEAKVPLNVAPAKTDVGTYTAYIEASSINTYYNYNISNTQKTFVITRATDAVVITTNPMSKTYDGYPPLLEYATESDGTKSFVWYAEDGRTVISPPTESGTYKVKVTVTQGANYNAVESDMYTYVINPKRVEVVWSNLEFTYTVDHIENDKEIAVEYIPSAYYTTVFGETIKLYVWDSKSQAGTYTANVIGMSEDGNYIFTNYKQDFVIKKRNCSIAITGDLSKDYDGIAVSGDSVTDWVGDGIRIYKYIKYENGTETVLNSAPVNAGRYSVSVMMQEGKNYFGSDGYTEPKMFEIRKINGFVQINTDAQFSKIYDGKPVSIYDATGKKKYFANGDGNVIITWLDMDGNVISSGRDEGPNSGAGINGPTEEGQYRVRVSMPDTENCYGAEDSAIFNITKIEGSVKITANLNKTYDGKPVQLETRDSSGNITDLGYTYIIPDAENVKPEIDIKWYDSNSKLLTTAPTDAGDYTLVVTQFLEVTVENKTIDGSGNTIVDKVVYKTEATDSVQFTIAKAMPKFSAEYTQTKIYDDEPFSLKYELETDGKVFVTWYKGSEKIEYVPTNAGNYYAYLSTEEGKNYSAINTMGITVIIEKQQAVIIPDESATYQKLSKVYDDEPIETPKFTYTGDGRASVVWYTGSSQITEIPVNAGAYIAKITVSETENFKAAELDIGKVKYTQDADGTKILDPSEMIVITKLEGKINIIDTNIDKVYDGYQAAMPRYTSTGPVSVYWYKRSGSTKTALDTAPVNAGDYTVRLVYSTTDNWLGTEQSLDFTISPKSITAELKEIIREYNGKTAVTLKDDEYSLNGLIGNDSVKLIANGNFTTKNANVDSNNYYQKAYFTDMSIYGEDSANYVLSETSANVLGRITPVELVITPDDNQSKEETAEDPVLTYTVQGLIDGDVITGKLSREPGEYIGRYMITKGTIDAGTNYNITVTSGVEFIIKSRPSFDISIDYEGEGLITPEHVVRIVKGESQTYTFTPDEGWLVGDVIIDGKSLGAANSYTFANCSQDHSLKVIFAKDILELDVSETTYNTITLVWNRLSDAVKFNIERSEDGKSFELVGTLTDGTASSYTDTNLESLKEYYYRVKPYLTSGSGESAYYYSKIKQAETALAAPVLIRAKSSNYNAITVTWEKSRGAYGYNIFRYVDDSRAWKNIGSVVGENTTSFTDKTAETGITYRYTVRAYIIADGKQKQSNFDTVGKTAKAVPNAPTLKSVKMKSRTSAVISWSDVDGAERYHIYRSETGATSGYKRIKVVTAGTLSYTDTGLTEGKTYYYTVRADYADILGDYNSGLKIAMIPATPKVTAVSGTAYNKLKVTWSKVADCDGYLVYRSLKANGGFTKVATVKSKDTVTYTDTVPECGVTYYYTVKAYWTATSGTAVGLYNAGVAGHTVPTTAKISKTQSAGYNAIKLTWTGIKEANGYRIYRTETKGKDWKLLTEITNGTTVTYTDKTAVTGKTYYYTIRSFVSVNGANIYGSYDKAGTAGKAIPATPKISSAKMTGARHITLTWNKIAGASGYRVYRSTKSTSGWTNIATIKNGSTVSYVDSAAIPGTQYYYTVRAYTTVDSANVYSDYVRTGTGAKTTLSTPKISTATAAGYNSVTLKWGKQTGVDGYVIYRSTKSSGSWAKLKSVKGTLNTYTDTTAVYNTQYYYTIKSYVSVGGKNYYSGYATTGTGGKATAVIPEFTAASASYNSVKLTWKSVGQADGYIIYRTTNSNNTGWKPITKLSGEKTTSYTDSTAECGTVYYYTMRSYKSINGKNVQSGYLKNGKSCKPVPSEPKATAARQQDNSVYVEWSKIDGADGYYVYRMKTTDTKWTKLAKLVDGELVYMDMTAEEAVDYVYTVKAYRVVNNKEVYSSYSKVSVQPVVQETV